MNKFDLTKARPQWLVALLALALTFALTAAGCAGDQQPAQDAAANDAATEQQAPEGAEAAAADTVNVTVAIDMPDNGMADSKVVETAIPAGGTAFDALEKSGATVQSEDGEYGKFVTAIDGIENGSQGASSGWVYTVNDEQVTESCDKYVLAEGDTVTWSFYVG